MKQINQRIAETGIFVFSYDPQTRKFTYSRPFTTKEAKDLAEQTNATINSQYKGVKGLRKGLAAKNGKLVNMSTLKGIVANRVLMQSTNAQQWLPTIQEGITLQRAGMFPSGILIDIGIALYNEQAPNKEIAKSLANEGRYVLPVLASFKSLDLSLGGKRYGVTPRLVSADGLTSGKDATKLMQANSFYQGEGTGVRGVCHSNGDFWCADWNDDLGYFYEDCRVGRFSAKGSAQKLEEEALGAFAPIRKSLDSVLALAQ